MVRQSIVALGVFASIVTASPLSPNGSSQWTYGEIPPSKSLVWYPCFDNFSCAVLDVPLDYQKPEGHRATVPMFRSAATTKPYKGTVLANPGGPGISGVKWALSVAPFLTLVVGTNYDIISWDPRGVGQSIPSATCLRPNLPSRSKIPKIHGPESNESDWVASIESSLAFGELCEPQIGGKDQAGPHMTTAIVARDMISILDAFAKTEAGRSVKEPALLNYWGISYGTMLGQTFASMFPKRVGRVLLDGVVDPDDFVSGQRLFSIIDADKAFSAFFNYCHAAGPSRCSFYRKTPKDIYNRYETLLYKIDPIAAAKENSPDQDVIRQTLNIVRVYTYAGLYAPIAGFPFIANLLSGLEIAVSKGLSWDTFLEWYGHLDLEGVMMTEPVLGSESWGDAVQCSDSNGRVFNRTLAESLPLFREFKKQSFIGSTINTGVYIRCLGWSIRSDDVFEGPFGGRTKNPILFVGSTLDPITPLVNAKNGAKGFDKAEVLTVEGAGHGTEHLENKCAYKKMNTFFQTGKLPGKEGSYCQLEAAAWGITLNGPLEKRVEELVPTSLKV